MIGSAERHDLELERAAVASACRRYLVATRKAPAERYDEIEEQAWRELQRALERLGRSELALHS